MSCTQQTACANEFDYVRQLARGPEGCCGPLVTLTLNRDLLWTFRASLMTKPARELLRSGSRRRLRPTYRLCAHHWMSLACWSAVQGHQFRDDDWYRAGCRVLVLVIADLGWDLREIVNYMQPPRLHPIK